MVKEGRLPPHFALKLVELRFCAMLMVPVMKHDVQTRVWDGLDDHGYPHRWAGLNSKVDDRTMRWTSQHPVTWYYYLSRIQSYPDCGWGCKENIISQATLKLHSLLKGLIIKHLDWSSQQRVVQNLKSQQESQLTTEVVERLVTT